MAWLGLLSQLLWVLSLTIGSVDLGWPMAKISGIFGEVKSLSISEPLGQSTALSLSPPAVRPFNLTVGSIKEVQRWDRSNVPTLGLISVKNFKYVIRHTSHSAAAYPGLGRRFCLCVAAEVVPSCPGTQTLPHGCPTPS